MKVSACGQAFRKSGNDRENQKAEAFSVEAEYDLEVSPGEYPAFFVCRELASHD
jgi:hypothetical protein